MPKAVRRNLSNRNSSVTSRNSDVVANNEHHLHTINKIVALSISLILLIYYLVYVLMVCFVEHLIITRWIPLGDTKLDGLTYTGQFLRSSFLTMGFLIANRKRDIPGLLLFSFGSSLMHASTYHHVTYQKLLQTIDSSVLGSIFTEVLKSTFTQFLLFLAPVTFLEPFLRMRKKLVIKFPGVVYRRYFPAS